MSDVDRSMHISLWALVAHSSFIEGSHTTKNTASAHIITNAELSHKSFIDDLRIRILGPYFLS